MAKIKEVEGLSEAQAAAELARGGRDMTQQALAATQQKSATE